MSGPLIRYTHRRACFFLSFCSTVIYWFLPSRSQDSCRDSCFHIHVSKEEEGNLSTGSASFNLSHGQKSLVGCSPWTWKSRTQLSK